ncbi:hypothetical protein NFJ02_30g76960 [Pycnococcus provasolii]
MEGNAGGARELLRLPGAFATYKRGGAALANHGVGKGRERDCGYPGGGGGFASEYVLSGYATVKKPHRLIQLKMSSSSNVMRFTLQRSANRIMRTFTLIRMKKKCDETRR